MKTAVLKPAALMLLIYVAAALVTNSQTTNKPATQSDVKVRQRMSFGPTNSSESILYIKGPRMRSEMAGGMGYTTIQQCDLKRTLTLNDKAKTYLISSMDGSSPATVSDGGASSAAVQPSTQPRGGVVNVTNTITDTGERKQMFGFTARHIKTSIEMKASPEACAKDQKMETDGWYIDFNYTYECPGQTQKYQAMPVQPQPGCKDEIRSRTVGT